MRKNIASIIVMLILSTAAKAEADAPTLTDAQKIQVGQAIQFLLDTGVMQINDKGTVRIEPSILDLLKQEGLFEKGKSKTMSICAGNGT